MSKMEEWHSTDLILLIKWVNFDNNDLVQTSNLYLKVSEIADHQWEDWTSLRFEEPSSKNYRVAVNKMAEHLAEANLRITNEIESNEFLIISPGEKNVDSTEVLEEPEEFYDESVNEFIPWSEQLTHNLDALSNDIVEIGKIMEGGTSSIKEAKNKSPQYLLPITARLGNDLEKVADPYFQKAQDTAELIYSFDSKMNVIIEFLNSVGPDDPNGKQQSDAIVAMSSVTSETRKKLNEFVNSIKKIEKISRPLYKPLQKTKNATTICNSAFSIVESWGLKLATED